MGLGDTTVSRGTAGSEPSKASDASLTLVPFQGPPDSLYVNRIKRALDIGVSIVCLLVSAIPMAVFTVAVLFVLGRPVFYRQVRVGRFGQPFTIVKFRTMRPDRRVEQRPFDGPDRRRTHKSDRDPRHTGLGRFLRRTSLDELPQLFNVLRGDMSIVGPRPEIVHVAMAGEFLDHPRHLVRPGITGTYQISPVRRSGRLADGLHLDEEYLRNVSLRQDLRVLLRTPGAVLSGS